MSDDATLTAPRPPTTLDYSLTGENSTRAIERGLAEADWYQCPVPRATMRDLLQRRDGPAIRDTLLWLALLLSSAALTVWLWPSWWAVAPYLIYAVLYSSTSDARWHEGGHGTAFRTDWMNNALYEFASFLVMRESVVWRWSHTRHHSDTIIVGRDPEIASPRPPNVKAMVRGLFGLNTHRGYWGGVLRHAAGRMSDHERAFIPDFAFPAIRRNARIYLAIYLTACVLAAGLRNPLPLLFVGLTPFFGSWLMTVYGLTQHLGLAENVLDHRLNCRTVYMNALNRFLYLNMGYHVEHHMFPLVPYHALARLHAAVKVDMPAPYPGLWAAWKEMVVTVWRQLHDPGYHVKRKLPAPKPHAHDLGLIPNSGDARPDAEGWIEVCAAADLGWSDVLRFDHGRKTYALIRDGKGILFATDGICTHGNTHLADGLVKGDIIECPKHNGRFFLSDGSPARTPVCRGLATYPIEERNGRICLNVALKRGSGARAQMPIQLKVIGTRNVATFIREIELEPIGVTSAVEFTPGDYLQVEIPPYERLAFRDFDIPAPYADVWELHHVFDLVASNSESGRRNNYSLASNAKLERTIRFNVRIATPPPGQDCSPGIGSAYMFSLRPGDQVTAIGPFGDFHIKPTQREMIYIGGGAGMAPLRAHISHLFETEKTRRRVSFWYGARSRQEIYYADYFRSLAVASSNFSFHLALSAPMPEDAWEGHTGFIHEVVLAQYLQSHPTPASAEYYLCGPPMMIKAVIRMLHSVGVPEKQIAFDEF